ncbi:MAG: DHH family phosphoesterase [Clostridiales bacterium]|nr:DHH family phosphoesterase [Clostridiales bacterium]
MKKRYGGSMEAAGVITAITVLLLCGIFTFYYGELVQGCVLTSVALLLGIYEAIFSARHRKKFSEFVKMLTSRREGMSSDAISKFPLPMAVLQINGQISWYNDLFAEMLGSNDLYNIVIGDVMPEIKWSEILKSTKGIYTYAGYKGHKYNVVGDIIRTEASTPEKPDYSVLLYFIDKTEIETLRNRYENEKTDIAVVNIDNYDEIFQKMDDSEYQQTISGINKYISAWVSDIKGVMKKTERDRYLVLFEHRYLKNCIQKKFDVIEKVRSLSDTVKMPVSVSIGVGVGGTILENNDYARAALDMALGRGGDQAAVKDASQYNFYGGISKDYEKSTRVKTRAFSVALKDFIKNSDKVIFMGHSALDYDAFGAAIGLQRAVRTLGKVPYIVFDNSPAVKLMADDLNKIEEYRGMLISPEAAEDIITMNTLLVVLDTHRPSMMPNPELLKKTTKVVLIDHHRRSAEFLTDISLVYHEPYASSACEMATEILQYINDSKKLTAFEAKSLYVGILMDTKNFTVKTGVRTFEAASYLRRYGLNTSDVRRLFNSDKEDFLRKAEIIKKSVSVNDKFLVSVCDNVYPNMKVISSQAADEMLNISGVSAAFVLYPLENEVCLSARSLGDVNVQLIAEKLGGGGHSTVAGAQLKINNLNKAFDMLKKAINEYIEENRKD